MQSRGKVQEPFSFPTKRVCYAAARFYPNPHPAKHKSHQTPAVQKSTGKRSTAAASNAPVTAR